jgi:hypothetical protein
MRSGLLSMILLSLVATAAAPQTQLHELIARAKSLELDTPYVPPPGDPLAHHADRLRQGYVYSGVHDGSCARFCC